MKQKLEATILPTTAFLKPDGTFDLEGCIRISGLFAGECYDQEGFSHLKEEPLEKTLKRVDGTFKRVHHSVYGHVFITLELVHIPKILAMVLNNENYYNTSEKSARYTKVVREEGSIITHEEEVLYNKWKEILKGVIKSVYPTEYTDIKIVKLAQENARYMVTSFMPTQMVYTTDFRQFNYLCSFMERYISEAKTPFEKKLSGYMQEFIDELDRLHILKRELMRNEKNRKLSLFGENLLDNEIYFSDTYSTLYKGSIAELAQAHRQRPLKYKMEFLKEKEYFLPPILEDNKELSEMWSSDIRSVSHVIPQGELVLINERGYYENFIDKCKERLCANAQLEIMRQTKKTLEEYKEELLAVGHPLSKDIINYTNGARCTFKDFTCPEACGLEEGPTLKRLI